MPDTKLEILTTIVWFGNLVFWLIPTLSPRLENEISTIHSRCLRVLPRGIFDSVTPKLEVHIPEYGITKKGVAGGEETEKHAKKSWPLWYLASSGIAMYRSRSNERCSHGCHKNAVSLTRRGDLLRVI